MIEKALSLRSKHFPTIFTPHRRSKFLYLSLLTLLFELLTKIRKEGLMSIEAILRIFMSAVFAKYPDVIQDEHLMEFLTDYLRLMVSGNVDSHQIENLMDVELEAHHTDEDQSHSSDFENGRWPTCVRHRRCSNGCGSYHGICRYSTW